MARTIYIIDPTEEITPQVEADAATAGAGEIVKGIPPRLEADGVTGTYPFAYTEPVDPERTPVQQAVNQLRNTFNTPRTLAQVNNSIDAITLILRRIAKNEMDRS